MNMKRLVALVILFTCLLSVQSGSANAWTDDYPTSISGCLHNPPISGEKSFSGNLKGAGKDTLTDPWGEWNRECVSFCAWRLYSRNGYDIAYAYGYAVEWGTRAKRENVPVNTVPAVGAIAWWAGIGHVAWVEAVSKDGQTVTVEEYNYSKNLDGYYNERTIPASSPTGYIHFKDIVQIPPPPNIIEAEREGWTVVGGGRRSKAAVAAVEQAGSLWLLHVGYDTSDMYLGSISPSDGSGVYWETLPGHTDVAPSMTVQYPGSFQRYYAFLGQDGYVYQMMDDIYLHTRTTPTWMNGARSTSPPSLIAFNGRLYPIVKGGADNTTMIVNAWTPADGWWPNWWALDGRTNDRPGIASMGYDLYAIHKGDTGQIYIKDLNWNTPWYGLPGSHTASAPHAVEYMNRLCVAYRGDNNHVMLGVVGSNLGVSPWIDLGGTTYTQPTLIVFSGHLYAMRVSPSGYIYIKDVTSVLPP